MKLKETLFVKLCLTTTVLCNVIRFLVISNEQALANVRCTIPITRKQDSTNCCGGMIVIVDLQCCLDDNKLLVALCQFDEMDLTTEAALFIMRIHYVMYLALCGRFVWCDLHFTSGSLHIHFTFIRF